MDGDKTLHCVDCGEEFIWTEKEQEFFAQKQFNEPKRCQPCRKANKDRRDRPRHDRY